MFQYAAGKSLAESLHTELKLYIKEIEVRGRHNGFELSRIFHVNAEVAKPSDAKQVLGLRSNDRLIKLIKSRKLDLIRGSRYIVEKTFHFQPALLKAKNNSFIRGYWKSEKYFLNHTDLIRSEFEFCNLPSEDNIMVMREIQNSNSISIHNKKRRLCGS